MEPINYRMSADVQWRMTSGDASCHPSIVCQDSPVTTLLTDKCDTHLIKVQFSTKRKDQSTRKVLKTI